jgi:hypothetical protein
MKPYSTTADLARHFKVTRATINAMVGRGEIPPGTYVRMGTRGMLRFDIEKVEAHLLQSGRTPTASPDPRQAELDFGATTSQEL